jgi:hypothetical protein
MEDPVTFTAAEPTARRLDETARTAIARMAVKEYTVVSYQRAEPATPGGVWSAELRFSKQGRTTASR